MKNTMEAKLLQFAQVLVDQNKAEIIVPAQENSTGFWYGGGNMVSDSKGNLYVTGRYRNFGDSRTGTGLGLRGLELAIFKSEDKGKSFKKVKSFSKKDLALGEWDILSIEGTALNFVDDGVELYISTEKLNRPFPEGYEDFHKPGTGSWTIELMSADSIENLSTKRYKTILENKDPRWFNMKDPFLYKNGSGDLVLGYCTHPFNWSSSNTGYVVRKKGSQDFSEQNNTFFPRGFCWDVGITRGTGFLRVPQTGDFANENLTLLFYDGGEAMRQYDSHEKAVARPRGYSCEELGGVAYIFDDKMENPQRLSVVLPSFVSPYSTGCSRYVDILETEEGYYTTWQQTQDNSSQPLVMNFLSREDANKILS
jgi:hypothetical protein